MITWPELAALFEAWQRDIDSEQSPRGDERREPKEEPKSGSGSGTSRVEITIASVRKHR